MAKYPILSQYNSFPSLDFLILCLTIQTFNSVDHTFRKRNLGLASLWYRPMSFWPATFEHSFVHLLWLLYHTHNDVSGLETNISFGEGRRRKWHLTAVFLENPWTEELMHNSSWDFKELDTNEQLSTHACTTRNVSGLKNIEHGFPCYLSGFER